ncbi:MAG: metallophosphoesterase [Deltaproteobacteria bacterium]|nr:metallophosphoesterase [Deltaproteobacteria bacterium]
MGFFMLATPATIIALRLGSGPLADVMAWVAFPWIAFAGLATMLFAVRDGFRMIVWAVQRLRALRAGPPAVVRPEDPARRQFLAQVTGGAIATAAVGAGAVGARTALGEHQIETVEIHLAKLPPALDGFTITQLTDLHVGLTIDTSFVEDVVAVANGLGSDLIVLTGDLVDGPVDHVRDRTAPLGNLRAPHGVFAVTGNHEYYSDADAWLPVLSALGIRFLRNERVAIGRGADTFDLLGIDDFTASHYDGHGMDLAKATAGRDLSRAAVLLAHQPRQVRAASANNIDLQLSGHTHGGQIWPWHYVVKIQQRGFLAGHTWHRDTQLYTSRGVGYWGPPVRIGAPPEITRIVLRRGEPVRDG